MRGARGVCHPYGGGVRGAYGACMTRVRRVARVTCRRLCTRYTGFSYLTSLPSLPTLPTLPTLHALHTLPAFQYTGFSNLTSVSKSPGVDDASGRKSLMSMARNTVEKGVKAANRYIQEQFLEDSRQQV